MPLNDSYWRLLYSSLGIDPDADDREERLSLLRPVETPTYRGMSSFDYDPYAGGEYSLTGQFTGALGSFLGTGLKAGGDLFDAVGSELNSRLASDLDLLDSKIENPWLSNILSTGSRVARQEVELIEQGAGIGSAFSGIGEEIQDASSQLLASSRNPLEHGGIWEEIKNFDLSPSEVGGFISEQAVNMATMAAAGGPIAGAVGGLTKARVVANHIATGYAANQMASTFSEQIDRGAGLNEALALGALDATATGLLERMGIESAFGRGVAGIVGANVKSRAANTALQAMSGLIGEGATESAQQLASILINELPDNDLGGWDETGSRIASRIATELPEAAAGGALFGLSAGAASGFASKPFASHALDNRDALGTEQDPQDRIADKLSDSIQESYAPKSGSGPAGSVALEAMAEDLAEASRISELKNKLTIQAQLEEDENIRAAQQEHITPPIAEKIGEALQESINTSVINKVYTVASLQQMDEQLSSTFSIPGEDGVSVEVPVAHPEERISAIVEAARESGIDIEFDANGQINWAETAAREEAKQRELATRKLAPMAASIERAVDLPAESGVRTLASAAKEPAPATGAQESPVLKKQRARALLYQPDLSSLIHWSPDFRSVLHSQKRGLRDYVRTIDSLGGGSVEPILMGQWKNLTDDGKAALATIIKELTALTPLAREANKLTLSNKETNAIGDQIASLLNKADEIAVRYSSLNTVPEVVALDAKNRVTRFAKFVSDSSGNDRFVIPEDFGITDEHFLDAASEASAATRFLPVAKQVVHGMWQLGTQSQKKMLEAAIMSRESVTDLEVGNAIKETLAGTNVIPGLTNADPAALGRMFKGTAHGLMNPWSLKNIMRGAGITDAESGAAMSAIDAMASRWMSQSGGTIYEFWDRLGDKTTLTEVLSGHVAGRAIAEKPIGQAERILRGATDFGRGFIELFSVPGQNVGTVMHEMIHLLEMSGLMVEMLTPEQRSEFEEWLGHPIAGPSGRPLTLPNKVQEKMARGFERFLVQGKAPKGLESAFQTFKEFMSDLLHFFGIDAVAVPKDVYGFELRWSDIELDEKAMRSFYMLLNANPDGSPIEFASTAGAPGLTKALELELSASTGLPAEGVFTTAPRAAMSAKDPATDSAIGLTNPDANGTAFSVAREQMADEIDATRELHSTRPALSVVNNRQEFNKNLQDAVASEAPLADSPQLFDELMDHYSSVLFTGGKDALYFGKKKNGNLDQSVSMLRNFAQALKHSIDVGKQKGVKAGVSSALGKMRGKSYESTARMWKWLEKSVGNVGARHERLLEAMGLPHHAEWINNSHALGKLANGVPTEIPKVMNPVTLEWQPIPGAERFTDITESWARFAEAYAKSRWPDRQFKQVFDALWRDLNIYLVVQRQLEIARNAEEKLAAWRSAKAAWDEAAANPEVDKALLAPAPRKPKVPNVNPLTTAMAENAERLLRARYGKDISMFEQTSLRLVGWENKMVLYKLRYHNMITDKAYNDMMASGQRYIPLAKLKDAVEEAGILDVRLDESMYAVLDYLKSDASESIEAPIDQMLRKAKAIELLTHRQLGRNVLGKKILDNFDIWDQDAMGITLLTKDRQVTEEEWNNSPLGRKKFTKKHYVKDAEGKIQVGEDGKQLTWISYHVPSPVTAEEMRSEIDKMAKRVADNGKLGVTAEQAKAILTRSVFTFYPEPGIPMYVVIPDPELASSIFAMNNPQALFAASLVERWRPSDKDDFGNPKPTALLVAQRALHEGVFGWGGKVKRAITLNPQFIVNAVFRDLPNALARSRHGLFITDWVGGFGEALFYNLPSLRELDPERHWLSIDASKGTGNFVGLVSSNQKDISDSHMLAWLAAGKSELMDRAKKGDASAKRALLWKDLRMFAAREGMLQSPVDLAKSIAAGEKSIKNTLLLAASPVTTVITGLRMIGNLTENSWRMAERKLSMQEEITDPRLLPFYNTSPEALVQGKVRAGFNSVAHRRLWEAEKQRMASDPNYIPPSDTLPRQWNAAERDYSMTHVTLNFSQKGTATHTLESTNMFFNPSAQDVYTSMQKIARWSVTRKVLAKWGGKKYEPLANQQLLDKQAATWLVTNIVTQTIPMLVMAAMYSGDDEDSKRWQAQSFIEKMSYWHLPNPWGDHPIRIASGIGFATLMFKDLPVSVWLRASGNDPGAMSKWGKRFLDVTPVGLVVNPIVSTASSGFKAGLIEAGGALASMEAVNPLYEFATGYDSFREKPIARLTNEDPTEAGRESYNALANTFAKTLKIQPAEASYLIRRYFPGIWATIPSTMSMAMDATGQVEEDVQPTNSPIAGQTAGIVPKMFAKDPWGMGNEFVQDLLRTTVQSEQERRSYFGMPESRRPSYEAEHPLVDNDLYVTLKNASDSVKSGEEVAKEVLLGLNPEYTSEEERSKVALDLRREYTLLALETMRSVLGKVGKVN